MPVALVAVPVALVAVPVALVAVPVALVPAVLVVPDSPFAALLCVLGAQGLVSGLCIYIEREMNI